MEEPLMCYWCDCVLYKQTKTRDHILSRFIRNVDKRAFPYRTYVKPACAECNQKRGRISDAYRMITKQTFGKHKQGVQKRRRTVKKLLRGLDLQFFQPKVVNSDFPRKVRALCLKEIYTVNAYLKETSDEDR